MPDIFVPSTGSQPATTPTAEKTAPANATALIQHPMPFFTTMFKNPSGVSFANQDPDETIILFLRRDFITNFLWIFVTTLLFLTPPVLTTINAIFPIFPFSVPPNFASVLLAFYYLVVIGYALFHFISWFYNISIVTDREVVDINYVNLVSKNVEQATFDSVQDIKYQQGGFLQSFFNYGLVTMVTEGVHGDINFESIPRPGDVAGIIQDLKNVYTQGR